MSTSLPADLRRLVVARSNRRCEYCGKPEIGFFPHEVDHIIAEKHGGASTAENLAFACFECNRYKGSDIASIDPETQRVTPLFHPRTQRWLDHFRFERGFIIPLTAEGRVTVALLRLNEPTRVQERIVLSIGVE
jgi:5-methylcytosine-specific restriction endonuclease McrA